MSVACRTKVLLFLAIGIAPAFGDHPARKSEATALLFPRKGRQHFPITTANAEAQGFFDQALTLYYGFNHEEAVRSFRKVLELDPSVAMAWWGIGLARGPNYNRDIDPVDAKRNKEAYDAAQKARTMAEHVSPRERAYIEALAVRYSLDPKADGAKLERDYRRAMKKVYQTYPDDLHAGALYVEAMMNLRPWKLWGPDGRPAEDTDEVVAVLQELLRRNPDHVGACHFQIHALEASPFPERALPSADRLFHLVPWQGHLTHMPGHIYIHTGDFDKAARCNELAIEADEAYFRKRPDKGVYRLMYYPHNIHFLAFAHTCSGRYAEARQAAEKLAAVAEPELEHMPMLEGFVLFPLLVDLRFQRWDRLLSLVEPPEKRLATRAFWHYARACALAAGGKSAEAAREQQSFLALAAKIPEDAPFGMNTAGRVLEVARKTLEARLERVPSKAVALWQKAVQAEDALSYGEPPDWIFRGREGLGAALLRADKPREAEAVFREELRRVRRSGRALFGLMHSLLAQDRNAEAELVRSQFERAWAGEITLRLEDF